MWDFLSPYNLRGQLRFPGDIIAEASMWDLGFGALQTSKGGYKIFFESRRPYYTLCHLVFNWYAFTNINYSQRVCRRVWRQVCSQLIRVGWRVTFEVVDTLTGSSSPAGRPFEEQPYELYRKWKVYTGN